MTNRKTKPMMTISKRAAVIVALVYGGFILVAVAPMFLFSFQQAQSPLIRVAGAMYTLTLLPAAVVAIWYKKIASWWMFVVSLSTAVALCLQEIKRHERSDSIATLILSLIWWVFVACIPSLIGLLLLTSASSKHNGDEKITTI